MYLRRTFITENCIKDINTRLAKAWTANDSCRSYGSQTWNKTQFFQSSGRGDTATRTLTKRMEKKLDGNYARMQRAVLNKSLRQHPTIQELYGHLQPITKTIQVRPTRHAGPCWRNKDKLTSDVFLWTPSNGQVKVGWPARTYIQQLYADTVCSLEDIPEAMDDRDGWRERVWEIRAGSATWWRWRTLTWRYTNLHDYPTSSLI